ncbi:MAG: hypothetical protein L7F78_07325 [Syntrophales bacterium LBB04]|nr:hypothetical protein [Syntrophales bacterium LBB04]
MDIETLLTKYNKRVKELEDELSVLRHKLDVLREASEIAKEEGIPTKQDNLFKETIPTSNNYKDMSMPEAILDALSNQELTGKEVYAELMRNGFKSTSKSLQGDVYGRLNRLAKDGKITASKHGKEMTRYRIAAQ